MAYISADEVKKIRDQIKNAYPCYKWSVTTEHSSTVCVALMESDLPFKEGHIQVNHYYFKESKEYTTKTKMVFQHIKEIINSVKLNYDRNAGDPYADYGDSNYFISLNVGKWNKPHKLIAALGPVHPRAMVGKVLTVAEIEQGQAECKATRIKYGIEPAPAGYIPYLGLSIVEEAI